MGIDRGEVASTLLVSLVPGIRVQHVRVKHETKEYPNVDNNNCRSEAIVNPQCLVFVFDYH